MGGDELAKGDEEGDLEGDGAGNGAEAVTVCVSMIRSAGREGGGESESEETYVQRSLRVRVKKNTMVAKVMTLGTRDTMTRNLARSAEDQARSR